MLSQKLQKDLMDAYAAVHEEKRGHAAGDSDVEKQASQLASDVRYKAKGKVKQGASEEEKKKIFLQILGASPAPSAVKAMARQKLLGEEVVSEMRFNDGKSGERLKALAKKRGIPLKKMKKHPQFQPEEFKKSGMGKGTGKPGGAMKKFLDAKAKKLQKEYDSQSKEKKNNPAFQSNRLNPKPVYNSYEPQGEVVEAKVDKLLPSGPFFGGSRERAEARNKRKFGKKDSGIDVPYKRGNKYNPMSSPGGSTEYYSAERGKETAAKRGVKKVKGVKEDVEQIDELSGKTLDSYIKKAHKDIQRSDKKDYGKGNKIDRTKSILKAVDKRDKKELYGEETELVHGDYGNYVNGQKTEKREERPMTPEQRRLIPEKKAAKDYDGDGKVESGTQEFLGSRDKAIKKAIAKRRGRVKEGFSAWRIDLDFNEQVKK